MKKYILTAIATAFTISAAQANDYPQECIDLEALGTELAELVPEMKAEIEATGTTQEERVEAASEEWAKLSDAEKEQARASCEAALPQVKELIESVKAQSQQ